MAISYPRTMPTHTGVAQIELIATNAVAFSRSPFSFSGQVFAYSGQMWQADVTLPAMKRDDAEQWVAWLVSLRGQLGTFLLGDPLGATARGIATGTPLIKGAGQTGGTILIDGATANVTGWLKAGDYVQIGTGLTARLHKVLVDTNSDSLGNVTLELWPHVRTAPADNAAVTISNTKGLFRLSSNVQSWSINQASIYGVNFGAMEAI